jgi:Rieske Fe-S protein
VIPVQILRSKRIEEQAADDEWLAASTEKGFIAWLKKCTHYCCVPGFKHLPTVNAEQENQVYCQCHQSTYDPFTQKLRTVPGRPRPEDR